MTAWHEDDSYQTIHTYFALVLARYVRIIVRQHLRKQSFPVFNFLVRLVQFQAQIFNLFLEFGDTKETHDFFLIYTMEKFPVLCRKRGRSELVISNSFFV
jgi:hypothetical protein